MFVPVIEHIGRTYIGRVKNKGKFKEAAFPPELWSICRRKIRTNNAAESVHNRLNKKTPDKVSVVQFLMIIEEEMRRTTTHISDGCVSATNAVEFEKNNLFARALSDLHSHADTLDFLDVCSSISKLRTKKGVLEFGPTVTLIETDSEKDEATKSTITNAISVSFESCIQTNNSAKEKHSLFN